METQELILNDFIENISLEREPDLTVNPYRYKGFHTFSSKCKVDVWYNRNQLKAIALISELPDNDGTSITNAAEIIITNFWNDYLRAYPRENCLFIETYDKHRGIDAIIPKWNNKEVESVSWKHIGTIVKQQ